MPIYVYQHKESGRLLEQLKPMAERDNCPAGFTRIEAPAPGHADRQVVGTIRGLEYPGSAEVKVPKALKEIERGERRAKNPMSARDISRHFGMPLDFIKRTWGMGVLFLAAMLALSAGAGDLTRGTTLFDGQRVSASQLHSLVDGATINTSFYTGKTLDSAPSVSDYLLLYSSAAQIFEKVTLGGALLNNPALVTGAAPAASVATNDQFMFYSVGGGQLEQINGIGLLTNFWTMGQQLNANVPVSFRVMVWDSGATNDDIPITNLLSSMLTGAPFKSSSTNNDYLLVLDGPTTNAMRIPWQSIYTNPPVQTTVSNADTVVMWSVNTNALGAGTNSPVRVPVTNVWPTRFTSQKFAVPPGGGVIANIAHGLPGTPQEVHWVLVCTNAEFGYAIGDELPVASPWQPATSPGWAFGANATNVFLTHGAFAMNGLNKNNAGSVVQLTEVNWNIKCYATFFPR